jgi:thiosulfate/3-mercaptopyruvate sulfurtransferase
MAFVKAGMSDPNVLVFDSRDPEEYDGSSDKSEGHLKGASHFNYKDVLNENGSFKSKEELEALAAKHGITKDKTAVFYCVTSVRACVQYVAFHEILGLPNIKVYDGAYNEWVANDMPIE